jgi:prepilin signal peptidase PulO-like enzyme (type II secretory pathway)
MTGPKHGRARPGLWRRMRSRPARFQPRTRNRRVRGAAVLAGLATAAVIGGWAGVGAGVVVGTGLWWAAGRWSTPGHPDQAAAGADLPIAVDLLAAALRAGAPPARAAEVVGAALGGPLGRQLVRVGTALRLGTRPDEAWVPLAGIPGGDRLRQAAVRSAHSGAALTGALARLADDLRAARAVGAEAGAQRLGVLVVLPLGLCFLPAFLLAGVVPVVAAVLGDVLRTK